jgi:hypothetical protein
LFSLSVFWEASSLILRISSSSDTPLYTFFGFLAHCS